MDSEPEESLDDGDKHNTADDAPSIAQVATQPSSDSIGGCNRTIVLWIRAEAGDGATSTLICFPFGACAGSILGLFNLEPILSTPAFGIDGVTALSCMAAFVGAPTFRGALAFGAAPAFIMDFIWEGAALDEAAFDEAANVPFGVTGAAFDEATPVPLSATGAF
jgi:hypothetical protein